MLKKRTHTLLLAVLLSCLTLTPTLRAERPTAPKLLPESTLAYIRVHDAQDLIEAFNKSSTGSMLNDKRMRPFFEDLYGSASEAFEQLEAEVGLSLDELLALPQGEACVAFVGADRGFPAPILMLQVDDKLPDAEKVLNQVIRRLQGRGGSIDIEEHGDTLITVMRRTADRQAVIFDRDGLMVISTDLDLVKGVLDVWDGNKKKVRTFAKNTHFTAIMRKCLGSEEDRPQISWFVDPISLTKHLSRGNFQRQAGLTLLEPLGLNELKGIGGSLTVSTENFEGVSHMHVLIEQPRSGILEMIALKEGDTTPEDWAPEDTASYTTVHWNVKKTYNELARILAIVRDDEEALDREMQSRISDRLNLDFKEDILNQLDGRATMLTWMQKPHRLNSQCFLLAAKLKNAKKFGPTLEKIVSEMGPVEKDFYSGVSYYVVPMSETRREALDPNLLRIPERRVLVLGDYVVFCDSQELLEKVIRTHKDSSKSLANSLDFKLMLSQIKRQAGESELGMFSFARPEDQLRSVYEFALAESTKEMLQRNAGSNPAFRALDRAMTDHPLPPFSVIEKYLSPTGSLLTNDETGIHFMQFTMKRGEDGEQAEKKE